MLTAFRLTEKEGAVAIMGCLDIRKRDCWSPVSLEVPFFSIPYINASFFPIFLEGGCLCSPRYQPLHSCRGVFQIHTTAAVCTASSSYCRGLRNRLWGDSPSSAIHPLPPREHGGACLESHLPPPKAHVSSSQLAPRPRKQAGFGTVDPVLLTHSG